MGDGCLYSSAVNTLPLTRTHTALVPEDLERIYLECKIPICTQRLLCHPPYKLSGLDLVHHTVCFCTHTSN